MAKGVRDVYLHPDNLMGGKKYRVTFKGLHDPSVLFIKEGKFVRSDLFWTNKKDLPTGQNSNEYMVIFLFQGGQHAIGWKHIHFLQEITNVRRTSDKPKNPKEETED